MKATITVKKEVEIVQLNLNAKVRYWEDTSVNGTEDESGDLIPFRDGENWSPQINIDTGQIINWPKGTTADIHYKVCDCCSWDLVDADGNYPISVNNEYVPSTLCPSENGFGDYIIMNIDENGFIQNWEFEIDDFLV